ncbi:MAG: hypothetical protein KDI15_00090 [Thiothrix sp.]|nr:hypothetical protein [Thiothrix sp.]
MNGINPGITGKPSFSPPNPPGQTINWAPPNPLGMTAPHLLAQLKQLLVPLSEKLLQATQDGLQGSFDLRQQISQAPPGAILRIPSGEYPALYIDKNITLVAQDAKTPPLISQIGVQGATQLTLENLRIGDPLLSADAGVRQ